MACTFRLRQRKTDRYNERPWGGGFGLSRWDEKGNWGNDSNLLIVFYVQIMPDDFVMQLHRF
ncbi:hypothetical protein [Escherichia coli]|uniref:hypothetical protein n=1 Tax=Escherichia coli TaxID=562 RepID=UPI003D7F5041